MYEYLAIIYIKKGIKTDLQKINGYVKFIDKKANDTVLNKCLAPVFTSANKIPKVFTQEKKKHQVDDKKEYDEEITS